MMIDAALEDLPGVKEATTSYAKQVVDVIYDDQQITEQQLIAAVREAGYHVVMTD